MSLRPFVAAWAAEAEVAPWVPPLTTGVAVLLGATLTVMMAHARAAQLRFNALAGLGAACAAAACAAALATRGGHASALLALPLPPGALALVVPRTLPGLALCAALCAAFGTLALLLLTAPKRARGARAVGRSAKAQKAKAPAAPVSPRGRVAPTDSFSFDAAEPAAGVTTPTLGGKKAAKAAPKSKTPAPRKTPAKRAPAASPEPPAPVASPVTSPARGRPSARKTAAVPRVASPKAGRTPSAAAKAKAAEVASPKSLKPAAGFASSRAARG